MIAKSYFSSPAASLVLLLSKLLQKHYCILLYMCHLQIQTALIRWLKIIASKAKKIKNCTSSAHYNREWLVMSEHLCVTRDKRIILKLNWNGIELAPGMCIIILQAQEFYGRGTKPYCASVHRVKVTVHTHTESLTDLKSPTDDTKPIISSECSPIIC